TLSSGKATTTISAENSKSPSLAASKTGCYIQWVLTFTDKADSQTKTAIAYTYVYKPYVIPYGAAGKMQNDCGKDSYNQAISWITGVHSLSGSSDFYPRYATSNNARGMAGFLSSQNFGYAGSAKITGTMTQQSTIDYLNPLAARQYAVFASTINTSAYFTANQTNSTFRETGCSDWFETSKTANNFGIASFRYRSIKEGYSNPSDSYNWMTSVSPVKGIISIDSSRYSNLSQIPNLGIGLMVTDNEHANDGAYMIVDYTGEASYTEEDNGKQKNSDSNIANMWNAGAAKTVIARKGTYNQMDGNSDDEGIKYAGSLVSSVPTSTTTKAYSFKSFIINTDSDVSLNMFIINLNANIYNKSKLRAAVQNAQSYFAQLGINSSTFTSSYFYTSESNSKWTAFVTAYKNACKGLTVLDSTVTNPDTLATNLTNALNALQTKVILDANGGTINGSSTANHWFVIGKNANASVTLSSYVPTRSGYAFNGWASSKTAQSGTDTFSLGHKDTLYAVWQAIGTTSDTAVIDFASAGYSDVLSNDACSNGSIIGVSTAFPAVQNGKTLQETYNSSTANSAGTVSIESNKLKFTPTAEFKSAQTYYYAVKLCSGKYTCYSYSSVTFVPANNILFEESAFTFENGTDAVWTDVTGSGNTYTGSGNNSDYGYSSEYANDSTYSLGKAKSVTVTKTQFESASSSYKWPSATFSFRGTGFDLNAIAKNTAGLMTVDLYRYGELTAFKRIAVNTYYDDSAYGTLYQSPVASLTGLDYGHYTIKVTVAYHPMFDRTYLTSTNSALRAPSQGQTEGKGNASGQYIGVIDSIRIYDPAGTNLTSGTVYETYKNAGELNPTYANLKSMLLTSSANGSIMQGETQKGSVYVEGKANVSSVADYKNSSANCEVMLAPGDAAAFKINTSEAKVQIGLRSADGNTAVAKIGNDTFTLRSATEMFYTVTPENSMIVIANGSSSGLVAVGKIKIIPSSESNSVSSVALTSDIALMSYVSRSLSKIKASPAPSLDGEYTFNVSFSSDNKKFDSVITVNSDKFTYLSDDSGNWTAYLDVSTDDEIINNAFKSCSADKELKLNRNETVRLTLVYENGEWSPQSIEIKCDNIKTDSEQTLLDKITAFVLGIFDFIIKIVNMISKILK
ncbi:MAG: InlB B-repeat-containing protein, partial [Oscillospiraceae bacterium]|nr:InlB B-repeat-containing protein [Oscillospiraceae bacterium]